MVITETTFLSPARPSSAFSISYDKIYFNLFIIYRGIKALKMLYTVLLSNSTRFLTSQFIVMDPYQLLRIIVFDSQKFIACFNFHLLNISVIYVSAFASQILVNFCFPFFEKRVFHNVLLRSL